SVARVSHWFLVATASRALDYSGTGHFCLYRYAHQGQQGRGDISEDAALADAGCALADIDEGHRLGGVGGVRLAGAVVGHLFAVAVGGGDPGFAAYPLERSSAANKDIVH